MFATSVERHGAVRRGQGRVAPWAVAAAALVAALLAAGAWTRSGRAAVRLASWVVAMHVPAPTSSRWAGRCTTLARGCVYLENHDARAVHILREGERPGPHNLVPPARHGVPGRRHTVTDARPGARAAFTVVAEGAPVGAVLCTVGERTWEHANPAAAWRPGGPAACAGDW
jgi:hypothetical protein